MNPSLRRLLRPLSLLITAQALAGSAMVLLVSVAGIIGLSLAPEPWLATLPNSAMIVGGLLGILPWSWVIQNRGWRPGLLGGLALGFGAALLAALGLLLQSFALFTFACMLMGGMSASVHFYVYAGADLVQTEALRRHVISAVITAGIVSAFLGPALVRSSGLIFPGTPFAGGFLGLSVLICLAAVAIALLPLPGRSATGPGAGGFRLVPWPVLSAGPIYGIIVSAAAFAMMVLLMVGAPMAMKHHGHGPAVSAGAIQWHFVGMYAPALVAGGLINRLGASLTATAGVALAAIAVVIGQQAHSPLAYTAVLLLCGAGWSFMHTAGTSMVVERCDPAQKVRVQGIANLAVQTTSVLAAFSAGPLLSAAGYPGLALTATVPLGLTLAALLVGRVAARRRDQLRITEGKMTVNQ